MNFVGKILIFMILVMSLVFMSFAVAVYATHQNWRAVVEAPRGGPGPVGLKFQLEDAQKENENLKTQMVNLKAEYAKEEAEQKRVLANLATEKKRLSESHDQLLAQHKALSEKDKIATAALATASQNLAKLTVEVDALRLNIRNTQQDRDQHFTKVVKLTDDKHQATGELRRAEERRLQLAAQVAAQKRVLASHNLNEFTPEQPPKVAGKITSINRNDMVEVSLGSDDGIRPGYTFEIFRGDKYLGRMQVLTTEDNRSVGKVLPNYKKGVIQEGDNVVTRFKLG